MKMKNLNLAIAIPTYNRSKILKENILSMLDEIISFSIPVYISDDSTNSDTEAVFSDLNMGYEYLYYKRNCPSLGHDKNCLSTLTYPTEKYIWYLSDSKIIKSGGIARILSIIEKFKPDFISVNSTIRNLNIESKLYSDGNLLLRDLGWHLSMTSATIYSKSILDNIYKLDLSKCVNFPQTALIFKCFALRNCCLYWDNEKIIYNNNNIRRSYWEVHVFQVFIKDWANCINNLDPVFVDENKKKAILAHSKNSGLFTLKSFAIYRYKGFFGWWEFKTYYHMLKKHSSISMFSIILILLIPRFVFISIFSFYEKKLISNK